MNPLKIIIRQSWFSFCLIVTVFALYGCEKQMVDASSSTDSLLVAILADLYLEEAEAQLSVASESDPDDSTSASHDGLFSPRRDSIMASHGLTEEQFQGYMTPYVEEPENLQKLYDRVLDRLNLERQQVQEP